MGASRKKSERVSQVEGKLSSTSTKKHRESHQKFLFDGQEVTQFQARLYQLCKLVPTGKVTTYGAMAKALGSAARAVGQGMRRNPFAPEVPCHRVIAADLSLGGFSGSWGHDTPNVQRKITILQKEGVVINNLKVSAECVLEADDLREILSSLKPGG
eukprot:gene12544-15762_t